MDNIISYNINKNIFIILPELFDFFAMNEKGKHLYYVCTNKILKNELSFNVFFLSKMTENQLKQ